jgi:hypothetical protein
MSFDFGCFVQGSTMSTINQRIHARPPLPRSPAKPKGDEAVTLTPLSLEATPRKSASPPRSSDPYNTSGSFDRTKNWARVGKR